MSNNYYSKNVIKRWIGERMTAKRLAKSQAKLIKTLQQQRAHFRNSATPLPYDIMEDFPDYPKPPPPIPIASYSRTFNTNVSASPIVLTPLNTSANTSTSVLLPNRSRKTRRKVKKYKKSRKHLPS